MSILKFPEQVDELPVQRGASRLTIWMTRLKERFCRLLNRVGVPSTIQETVIDDPLTGQNLHIRVGIFFTRISVNGRDYYFRRLSGKFDGTGTGCR